jgi:hypothetical protein
MVLWVKFIKKMLTAIPLVQPFLLHERNTLFEGTG